MKKINKVGEVKIIRRWSISVLFYAILLLCLGAIVAVNLFLPVISITRIEGTEITVTATGVQVFESFFNTVNTGSPDELSKGLLYYISNTGGVVLPDKIALFFLTYHRYFLIAVLGFFALSVLFAGINAIFALVYIITGRCRKPGISNFISKIFFVCFTLFTLSYFTFIFLYESLIKMIDNMASLSTVYYIPYITLASTALIMIFINLMARRVLYNRTFLPRSKKIYKDEF